VLEQVRDVIVGLLGAALRSTRVRDVPTLLHFMEQFRAARSP
jgi:hypothetical protein